MSVVVRRVLVWWWEILGSVELTHYDSIFARMSDSRNRWNSLLSSSSTFVPPYSGSNTMSPTLMLSGTCCPCCWGKNLVFGRSGRVGEKLNIYFRCNVWAYFVPRAWSNSYYSSPVNLSLSFFWEHNTALCFSDRLCSLYQNSVQQRDNFFC